MYSSHRSKQRHSPQSLAPQEERSDGAPLRYHSHGRFAAWWYSHQKRYKSDHAMYKSHRSKQQHSPRSLVPLEERLDEASLRYRNHMHLTA